MKKINQWTEQDWRDYLIPYLEGSNEIPFDVGVAMARQRKGQALSSAQHLMMEVYCKLVMEEGY